MTGSTPRAPAQRLAFPENFIWGAATAAFQIEGAAAQDGRGDSIWDTFCRVPGAVHGGHTGDVACDHYNRLDEDLGLMSELGLQSYRFSVSWSRVIPDGTGAHNQAGLDFYNRLVDGLLDRGIRPLLTLYHWDLPQALQDRGGWLVRDTAASFAEYAEVVARAVGDRVPTFTTLNEPFCTAFLGHGSGVHAPGITDNAAALKAAHHLNLAHGMAVTSMRSVLPSSSQVSVTLNLAQVYAESEDDADIEAVRHVDGMANRIFLDPILRGSYPQDLIDSTRHLTGWDFVHDGDLETIHAPIDVLGVNFYSPSRVTGTGPAGTGAADAAGGKPVTGRWVHEPDRENAGRLSAWPGTDRAWSVPQPGPYTDMGWRIEPTAFLDLLLRVGTDYPQVPLLITENGCAYPDVVGRDGAVHDTRRIEYLDEHLQAVHRAIQAGVDVRGYYVWSLLDNFEWALGYSKRFGIVHVDYDSLERTPKDSAHWYTEVIRQNGCPVAVSTPWAESSERRTPDAPAPLACPDWESPSIIAASMSSSLGYSCSSWS